MGGDGGALVLTYFGMAGVDFFAGGGDEGVEQVIGFYAETFAAGNLDPGAGFFFFAELVAEFGGATRREGDHLVREMRVAVGGFVVAQAAQGFDNRVLGFGLAGVDYVVDFGDIAKVGMILGGARDRRAWWRSSSRARFG